MSTICSSTRGPATTPSFVTCPTIKIVTPYPFAICIRRFVDSRTWLTLPGAEEISSRNMVWIESMITMSGFDLSMAPWIVSRFVSQRNKRSPVITPMRFARILICFKDSSPEI